MVVDAVTLAVDPAALDGAGVLLVAVGDGLASVVSTSAASFDADTGADSAGVMFGLRYVSAAGELLKAVAAGVNACRRVGYGVRVTAVNYSRAEAGSDLTGRSQALGSPPCPAPVEALGWPSASGSGFGAPALWRVVEFLVGDVWPSGDPASMRAAAGAWRTLAGVLHGVGGQVSGPSETVGAQQMDEAELIRQPIGDIAAGLADAGRQCERLASTLEGFAAEVAKTQQAIRDLLSKLGSIGGIVGTFFEFLRGHGEDDLQEIADDIKTVLGHLKGEAQAKTQILEQAKQDVDGWVRGLESWADREFVDVFGEDVGTGLATHFNMAAETAEGGFRWLVGGAEGVIGMNPLRLAYDPQGVWQMVQGLDQFGRLVTNPGGAFAADPEGAKNTLKGVVHGEDWDPDRPMVSLSQVVLDFGSALIPGFGGTKAASEAASATSRVARVGDEVAELNGSTRTPGKMDEIGRGPLASADGSKGTAGITSKLEEIAKKPPAPDMAAAGGRPVSLPAPVQADVPATAKQPVRDVPVAVERSPGRSGAAGEHEAASASAGLGDSEVGSNNHNPPHTQLYDPPLNRGAPGDRLPDLFDINNEFRQPGGAVDPSRREEWAERVSDSYPLISKDGVEGVYTYSTHNYDPINAYLRNVDDLSPPQSMALGAPSIGAMTLDQRLAWEAAISRVDDGLASLPPFRADPGDSFSVTWRGIRAPDSLLSQLEVGSKFSDPGYLSSSIDQFVAESFARGAGPGETAAILKIEGLDGVDVTQLSRYMDEFEVLFPRGSEFEILSRTPDTKGRLMIVLRQLK